MDFENKDSGLYGYPIVGRFGLGHSLLAWARCWTWFDTTFQCLPRIGDTSD
jgi:hypothetical protein